MANLGLGVGAGLTVVGLGGLAYWFATRSSSPKKKAPPKETKAPVYYAQLRQGTFDEDIGGGWTLMDVRELRVKPFSTDADVHTGHVVSLFLSNRDAPVKVFNVRVLGKTGDDFTGQWVTGQPDGGPQAIDFRGAHIFSFH